MPGAFDARGSGGSSPLKTTILTSGSGIWKPLIPGGVVRRTIVGGGGAGCGSGYNGCAGGAGASYTDTVRLFTSQTYIVGIGATGPAGNASGINGGATVFGGIAVGGGLGGSSVPGDGGTCPYTSGVPGGSGGYPATAGNAAGYTAGGLGGPAVGTAAGGGSSQLAVGGSGSITGKPVTPGYGAGGGVAGAAAASSGGNGGGGVIILEEFGL